MPCNSNLLLLSIISLSCFAAEVPHVIAHFDINKTIIADDPAGGKSVDDVVIQALTETTCACWDSSITEPVSYCDYVKQLIPGSKHNREIKNQRKEAQLAFLCYLSEQQHPLCHEVGQRFERLSAKLQTNPSFVFASFYRFIEHLKQNSISSSVILRTMGHDRDRVIEEIHRFHPSFFSWRGEFKGEALTLHSLEGAKSIVLNSTAEVYEFLKRNGNVAIRDDWQTWNQHGEVPAYGKPFPVAPHDTHVVTMFADDNGRKHDGILNPRNPHTNEPLDIDQLIKSDHICVADVLQAIENDEYYVNHLQRLLKALDSH